MSAQDVAAFDAIMRAVKDLEPPDAFTVIDSVRTAIAKGIVFGLSMSDMQRAFSDIMAERPIAQTTQRFDS